MTTRIGLRLFVLLVAAVLAGCDTSGSQMPTAPSAQSSPAPAPTTVPTPPQQPRFPPGELANVTLSGLVYERTPTGLVPVEGVAVYCELCTAQTHAWATTDANGFYSFFGVWIDVHLPTSLWVTKDGYADPAGVPTPTRPNLSGPGYREVNVKGDTRYDIELVRK